jgi:phosphohistidine phosphatase SixA
MDASAPRPFHPLRRAVLVLACGLAAATGAAASGASADPWTELARPGAIVLFRHATAPGVGDPAGLRLNDCSTQRNLDDTGRAEARRLGEQFRSRQVPVGAVLTSQWCRTRDTARLAFGDRPKDEPAFNSFFGQDGAARERQTAQARALLTRWTGPGVLVVVTHQVNISALTGAGAASAEGVVVRPQADGTLKVVATLQP